MTCQTPADGENSDPAFVQISMDTREGNAEPSTTFFVWFTVSQNAVQLVSPEGEAESQVSGTSGWAADVSIDAARSSSVNLSTTDPKSNYIGYPKASAATPRTPVETAKQALAYVEGLLKSAEAAITSQSPGGNGHPVDT